MKFFVLSVVVAVAVLGLTAEAGTSRLVRRQAPAAMSEEQQWTEYKATHKKSYPDPAEDALRFGLFKESLAMIKEHNEKFKKGEVTWEMGLNQFTDMTKEEKSRHHGVLLPQPGK